MDQKPIPADNFKKYDTKHNPKISILKAKIWVKQENLVSNISILLQNHHDDFLIKSKYYLLNFHA